MLREFIRYINKEQLFADGDSLLLAVSGGVDSVVLTDLMCRLADSRQFSIALAHCNFHLRGQDSNRDEKFVLELASHYGLPLYKTSFDTITYAQDHGISIEMAARDLRYDFFSNILREHHFRACVLAHHADDNAETFFINLLRGTGLKGIRGMLPQKDQYIRPLLFARRADIESYAERHKLVHVEDLTNAEDIYLRNKIRHRLIPMLEDLNGNFITHLERTMSVLRYTETVTNAWFLAMEKEWVKIESEKEEFISANSWKNSGELKFLFWEMYLRKNGFSVGQIKQIVENIETGISGKFFENTEKNCRVYREQNGVRLLFNDKKARQEQEGCATIKNQISLQGPCVEEESRILYHSQDIPRAANIACLDYEKLQFPLSWRHWQQGDYFYPLGLKGKQKLSDFFSNAKVPETQKKGIWLLCSGADIVWIMGYRIDDRYKIQFSDKKEKKAWVVTCPLPMV
ncbi:MAG: tRNA lysidine(34) synthetase TilS [Bacteroidales bacterium]